MELSSLKQETQTSLGASKDGDYMPSMDRSFTRYGEEFTEGVTETDEHTTDYGDDKRGLGLLARQVLQWPRVEGDEGLGRQQVEQEGGLGEGPG